MNPHPVSSLASPAKAVSLPIHVESLADWGARRNAELLAAGMIEPSLAELKQAMDTAASIHAKAHRKALRMGSFPPTAEMRAAFATRRAYFAALDNNRVV